MKDDKPTIMIAIGGDDDSHQEGKIVGKLLMQLLLDRNAPEAIIADIKAMIKDKPKHVQEEILEKINYLMEMRTVGMERDAIGDPMLQGEMPDGFEQPMLADAAQEQ